MKRADRLTPEQLQEVHVTGADGKLVPHTGRISVIAETGPIWSNSRLRRCAVHPRVRR